MTTPLGRRALSEFLATAGLSCAVIGSGIMARSLTHDDGLALLINTIATACALAVLILAFGPISGAHMNPVVTGADVVAGRLAPRDGVAYVVAQIAGALGGVVLANAMFALPLVQTATTARGGSNILLAEVVATAGLLVVIGLVDKARPAAIPFAVGAYIASAYWFTSSTSFANPAVTLARSITDTYGGCRAVDVPPLVVAEMVGAALGVVGVRALLPRSPS
jgi:glycerol uptake facilitator-like aquaporin